MKNWLTLLLLSSATISFGAQASDPLESLPQDSKFRTICAKQGNMELYPACSFLRDFIDCKQHPVEVENDQIHDIHSRLISHEPTTPQERTLLARSRLCSRFYAPFLTTRDYEILQHFRVPMHNGQLEQELAMVLALAYTKTETSQAAVEQGRKTAEPTVADIAQSTVKENACTQESAATSTNRDAIQARTTQQTPVKNIDLRSVEASSEVQMVAMGDTYKPKSLIISEL